MTEATSEHLRTCEQFLIGGRDTVIVVWALNALAVIGFLLLAP